MEELLRETNVRTAAIIDDVYDEVPRAEDVAESQGWPSFIDDLVGEVELIKAVFPDYDAFSAEQLRDSDEFVGAVWGLRDTISERLWNLLFEEYSRALQTDRRFLSDLEARLQALGVEPKPAGRKALDDIGGEDVVFIDLFLGAAQLNADMRRSIGVIKKLLSERPTSPPLVILMSSSNVLEANKIPFRDDAGLIGAMFRVHSKRELLAPGGVERVLERLATSKPDATRVANFIHRIDKGIDKAKVDFLRTVRRLDLSDYVHIRELLLSREGQPIGSYMLDVFDRVLQHEIEANAETIDAAIELNKIDGSRYPLAHVSGTSDTQDLVARTIWQHQARLNIPSTVAGIPVSFGDLLLKRSLLDDQDHSAESCEALLVVTPSCDLMREDGARTVLHMTGALRALTHKDWTYGEAKARTPILILPDGERMWIKWELKHPQTFTLQQLTTMLDRDAGTHRIAMRFREGQALELQQQMLADLGRVGVMAKMPATFPVRVKVSYHGTDSELREFRLPQLDDKGAVCYSGQDDQGNPNIKLVLSEEAVDEVLSAIRELTSDLVSARARPALAILQGATNLAAQLESGLKIKEGTSTISVNFEKDGADASQVVGSIYRTQAKSQPNAKYAIFVEVVDIAKDD